jgi:hypothetical protein
MIFNLKSDHRAGLRISRLELAHKNSAFGRRSDRPYNNLSERGPEPLNP